MKKIARAAFRRLAGKPDDAPPDTVPAAGRIHEMCREGKAQEAEQLLLGSLRARPTPAAARMLGTVYAMQQRYDEAIEALRGALDSESRHAGTANLIGVCCSLMDRHQEALRFYDAAIAADASLADAYANAGWSSSVLGRADAKKLFHDWLAICASERPEIGMRVEDQTPLEPGVVVILHPSAVVHDYEIGKPGYFSPGDTYVITEEGADRLNTLPQDLIIIE